MFGEFRGLPLHVLVVHAAVIFVPLAALCAVLFVALPRWRYLLRWPLVALTVISLVNVLVAVQSGLTFRSDLGLTWTRDRPSPESREDLATVHDRVHRGVARRRVGAGGLVGASAPAPR